MLQSLFSSPASCPPPFPLHPDQMIDTCTAWHREPAHSLIHEIPPFLVSLFAINTHTRTHTNTRVYTDTWAEEKQQTHNRRKVSVNQLNRSRNGITAHPANYIQAWLMHNCEQSEDDKTPRPLLRWRQITHWQRQTGGGREGKRWSETGGWEKYKGVKAVMISEFNWLKKTNTCINFIKMLLSITGLVFSPQRYLMEWLSCPFLQY